MHLLCLNKYHQFLITAVTSPAISNAIRPLLYELCLCDVYYITNNKFQIYSLAWMTRAFTEFSL